MKLCKDKINIILALVDKSERNIIRIQNVSDTFVYPVLNQWRHATRHIANILASDENDRDIEVEIQETITSLKMAYIDSCQILLLIFLRQAVLFFERYRRIKYYDLRFFIDYVKEYVAGRKLLEQKRLVEPNETTHMQNLEKTIDSLQQCYTKAIEKRPFFEEELKRYYRQRRAVLFSIIVSIIATLLTICITI